MAVQLTKVSGLSPLSDLNHTLANTDVVYAAVNSSSLSSAKVTMAQVQLLFECFFAPPGSSRDLCRCSPGS